MALTINRENGVPLHVQLREQMAHLIQSGVWRPGLKLPTERHLAEALDVSRNTVSLAYKSLSDRGLVFSKQGRGTFVSAHPHTSDQAADPAEPLKTLVDRFLDSLVHAGFELADVDRAINRQIKARRNLLAQVSVGFVECNSEQLDYFSRSLQLGAGVHVTPVLTADLLDEQTGESWIERLRQMDLVVTTFFHKREVEELLGDEVEVLGIALDPDVETMVRIAQLPREAPIALVCSSEIFASRVLKSMHQSGLKDRDVRVVTERDLEAVRGVVQSAAAVIASPGRLRDVRRLDENVRLIEFIYKPDAGSINVLQRQLVDKKRLQQRRESRGRTTAPNGGIG